MTTERDPTRDLRQRLSIVEAENQRLRLENAALAERARLAVMPEPAANGVEPVTVVDATADGEFGW